MIHKPATGIVGNADDLEKAITFLNTIQEGMETVYNDAANDDVTPETIHDMVNNETWLTGEQAKQYFNVTVLDSTQTVAKAGKSENMKNIEPFVRSLKKKLPDMPVEYVDERFTSVLAHRTMLEAGLKKKDRQNKALVDEISATIILQTYLENKRFSFL